MNRWEGPGASRALLGQEHRAQRGWESGAQLAVVPALSPQVHPGALSCAAEAGAAIPSTPSP